MRRDEEPPADPRHAWLPLVVPANAQRFQTDDAELAATLANAGAELVDEEADVELTTSDRVRGTARAAVAILDRRPPEDWPRLRRLVLGAFGSIRTRARSRRVRRQLEQHGYPHTAVLTWNENRPVTPMPRRRAAPAALVVGERDSGASTAVEAAAEAAGFPLHEPPAVRQGVVVAVGDEAVLRVAIGPAKAQIDRAVHALETLRTAGLPEDTAARIPWTIADGTIGLARWSLEPRLPGAAVGPGPSEHLLAECGEFLRALFAAKAPGREQSPIADAEVVGTFLRRGESEKVRALAERVTGAVANLPRGFAHGDFWTQNLLVDGDHLTGVIDWDAAGPGRLPLLDFIHLRPDAARKQTRTTSLGEDVIGALLPWARAGGDTSTPQLCAELGFDATPSVLEALVIAYWLDYVAYQLTLYVDRGRRPRWLSENVTNVVAAL